MYLAQSSLQEEIVNLHQNINQFGIARKLINKLKLETTCVATIMLLTNIKHTSLLSPTEAEWLVSHFSSIFWYFHFVKFLFDNSHLMISLDKNLI